MIEQVKKTPLDPPLGKAGRLMAPWGTEENAQVFDVVDTRDGKVQYATVYKPTGNFNVRYSVFRVR
jgi:hypothetical protein